MNSVRRDATLRLCFEPLGPSGCTVLCVEAVALWRSLAWASAVLLLPLSVLSSSMERLSPVTSHGLITSWGKGIRRVGKGSGDTCLSLHVVSYLQCGPIFSLIVFQPQLKHKSCLAIWHQWNFALMCQIVPNHANLTQEKQQTKNKQKKPFDMVVTTALISMSMSIRH